MQIDGMEGATHKFLKTRTDSRTGNDNAETRRTRRCRRGTRYPTPPVFCEKRLQTIENRGKEMEKERQEISRGGKLLKH
jgi:transcriptional regulator NrdR family protein